MKRDMDLIRALLLHFEAKGNQEHELNTAIDGYDSNVIGYHLNLMYDAGLITAEPFTSSTSSRVYKVVPFGLTWQGHEFLDAARDNKVWETTRKKIISAVAEVPFSLLRDLLLLTLKQQLGF